jgi:hypothetical protein
MARCSVESTLTIACFAIGMPQIGISGYPFVGTQLLNAMLLTQNLELTVAA